MKKWLFMASVLLAGASTQAQNLSKKDLQTRLLAMEQKVDSMKQSLTMANAEIEKLRNELTASAANVRRLEMLMKSVPTTKPIESDEVHALKKPDGSTKVIDATATTYIEFASNVHDFGKIKEGESVTHIFKFKNTGKVPLTITAARGSCGCTVPEWSKEPVQPGASGEVKVVFNSAGKSGTQSKTVTLTANTVPSETILTIKGEVEKKN